MSDSKVGADTIVHDEECKDEDCPGDCCVQPKDEDARLIEMLLDAHRNWMATGERRGDLYLPAADRLQARSQAQGDAPLDLLRRARHWMNEAVGASWVVHDMVNPPLFDAIDKAIAATSEEQG